MILEDSLTTEVPTTIFFPENLAVAIKLRDGISPHEAVEKAIRRHLLYPINPETFRKLETDVEVELRKYGVRVNASAEKNPEAPHGIVVTLEKLPETVDS